jgi:hypothetical protein
VVPAFPAGAIGRDPFPGVRLAPAQALPAEPEAAQGEKQGGKTAAEDEVAPKLVVLAQRGEIESMNKS